MKIKIEINLDVRQMASRELIKDGLIKVGLPAEMPGFVDKYIYFLGLDEVVRQQALSKDISKE